MEVLGYNDSILKDLLHYALGESLKWVEVERAGSPDWIVKGILLLRSMQLSQRWPQTL